MISKFLQSNNPNDPNYDPRYDFIPNAVAPDGGNVQTEPLGGAFGLDLFSLGIFNVDWWVSFLTAIGIFGILSWLWSIYVVLAYLFCLLLLALYVYATIRKAQLSEILTERLRLSEQMFAQQYHGVKPNSRLEQVKEHISSDNPNDWKVAIIEADIILDEAMQERGFAGNTLGERLKSASPQQLTTIRDAWEAHVVRNNVAHGNEDYVLTKRIAEEAITRYLRVFEELGVK